MRFGEALGLPRKGERLGDALVIGEIIGRGAMGVVLAARDEQLDRRVAVKFVRPEFARTEAMRAQFIREARAMARVRHQNVVAIHSLGEFEHTPYFVMEYVEGTTLRGWLAERKDQPIAVDEALGLLAQICAGVQALHDAGVVHRDIKPSNILIDRRFRVFVSDLGVGGLAGGPHIGASGTVAGALDYLAPEIFLGEVLSSELANRPDVYALGALAFELLVGHPPYRGKDAISLARQHLDAPVPAASTLRPELPLGFDAVLARALAKDPRGRLISAEALRKALFGVRRGRTG